MEIVLGVAGVVLSLLGLLITLFSRTDRLLTDIRDVLIQIRDRERAE